MGRRLSSRQAGDRVGGLADSDAGPRRSGGRGRDWIAKWEHEIVGGSAGHSSRKRELQKALRINN